MIYLQVERNGMQFPLKDANNFFAKFKGLMFKKNIDTGIFFKECSVHMFFMKTEIDIIMLDKKSNVLKLYPNAKPWRFIKINPKCKIIIELPAGSIEKGKIDLNSNLFFRIDKKKTN